MPIDEEASQSNRHDLLASRCLNLPLKPIDLQRPPTLLSQLVHMDLGALDQRQIALLSGGIIQTNFDVRVMDWLLLLRLQCQSHLQLH